MRIVAGEWGGRRLRAPVGRHTRPTAERVREALFSLLGDISGLRVLDLYAGSGALGLEALSRGAQSAVFIEQDARAVAALEGNVHALGASLGRAEIRRGDVLAALRSARERRETYDLIFADPPYRHPDGLAVSLSRSLAGLLSPGARVICESGRRTPLELELDIIDRRRYGDTVITIHQTPATGSPETDRR